MLIVNARKRWVTWRDAGCEFLLSPLHVTARQQLMEQATVKPKDAEGRPIKGSKPRLDMTLFQNLIAERCVHDWRGLVQQDEDGTLRPQPYNRESREAVMEIEPANLFILSRVQGLGMHLQDDLDEAGKGLPGAPDGSDPAAQPGSEPSTN